MSNDDLAAAQAAQERAAARQGVQPGGDGPPVASCLLCGHRKTLAVWYGGTRAGVCNECRAQASEVEALRAALKQAHETLSKRVIDEELAAGQHESHREGWVKWMARRRKTLAVIESALRRGRTTIVTAADCLDCGKPYGGPDWLDLRLPRDQWLMVHPDENGILCANCIVARAARLPKTVSVCALIEFLGQVDPLAALARTEGR
jgi:recombinational DNA repair protein (RecF pathway)